LTSSSGYYILWLNIHDDIVSGVKMVKLGIAGLGHETITFWPGLTDLTAFKSDELRGSDIVEKRRGTNTSIGGFIEVCEDEGLEMHPVIASFGGVTATVADRVYDYYMGVMKQEFSKFADELDGILLELHGAMVTESLQDTETQIVKDVRNAVGPTVPIMVALDLHGNISPNLLKEATMIFGYHCSPHTDRAETGRRTVNALLQIIDGKIKPTVAIAKPGLVVPSIFSTTIVSPGKDIINRLHAWEAHPQVVDISMFFGFAWSDVHHLGMSAVALTDNDQNLAQDIVEDLSNFAWDNREALTGGGTLYNVKKGVQLAKEYSQKASKPILIVDHADRTNDTTFVLNELLTQEVKGASLPLLWDPDAAEVCVNTDVGAQVELDLGAKMGWRDGGPVHVKGKVLWSGKGNYIGTGPMTKGLPVDLGTTAIIDVGGVWIQLVSKRVGITGGALIDEDPFMQFGYNPRDFKIIVSKSKTHFRSVYSTLSEEIIIVDAPGQCPADTSLFKYKNVPDGVYPITAK
jgi:microcystin degradation protein MlrC